MAKAIFAGGCFWGMEELIRVRPGILGTRVGYTGGHVSNPTYQMVCTKTTGHAEAIEIEYDNLVTSYGALLEFFFQIHDPTTLDRQGNDVGDSYRSEIFTLNSEQEIEANDIIAKIDKSGHWPGKVVTKVSKATDFWEAEPEHQNYLQQYPRGYTCHFLRDNWILPQS
jgi:methionine-S-sulfoxide reductase